MAKGRYGRGAIILVTGASGFLGMKLVKRLVDDGNKVIAVTRKIPTSASALSHTVKWVELDLSNSEIKLGSLPKLDAVVHLAGNKSELQNNSLALFRDNEASLVNLLHEVASKTELVVFASTQMVYGNIKSLAVSEDFSLRPQDSDYGCSKINSENWLRNFQRAKGGFYISLRFCGFIDGGGFVDYVINQTLINGPIQLLNEGKSIRDYLYSCDGIEALVSAIRYSGPEGFLPINIGSGCTFSALDIARLVVDITSSQSKIELISRPAPKEDFLFSIKLANEALNFHPTALENSIRDYTKSRLTKSKEFQN
jgi:nucleoside-diphosphate-sugar epimerase